MLDNIAAISSGVVNQPIGIIRVTGPESFEIVEKIFDGRIGDNRQITYGRIVDDGAVIDEVLIAWFKGNDNFVGQDLVEIYAHGGVVVLNTILELLLAKGARLAYPGEFSKIAFLNGKMDLIKAEAIHDLIFARTKKQAQASIGKFDNKVSAQMKTLISDVAYLIGLCEVNIDYPEYDDIKKIDEGFLREKITSLKQVVDRIVRSSEEAQLYFNGFTVTIAGKPNVGKSSILNVLLDENKAIVTDAPGTTRDVVEGEIVIKDVLFKLLDTAGIRDTNNTIEKIGVEKSFEKIKESDVVIHVLDEREDEVADLEIERLSRGRHYIRVYNKSDLMTSEMCDNKICVSAKESDIEALREEMISVISINQIDNNYSLNNARQLGLIKRASQYLQDALESLNGGLGFGVVIVDLRDVWESLQSITGHPNREDLLSTIFANFCLGK